MVKEYIRKFSEYAKAAGIRRLAFYLEEKETRKTAVYQGECEKLEYSQQALLFAEGEFEGFCGSVFIENFEEELFEEQVNSIKESALARKKPFVPYDFPVCPAKEGKGEWLTLDQLLEKLCAAEKAAYEADARIDSVSRCGCEEVKYQVTLLDHLGHSLSDSSAQGHFFLGVTAKENGEVQLGGKGKAFHLSAYPNFAELAQEAAESAASKLGASSYPTGSCPVVLEGSVVCELLDAFMPALFAKNVQNHMSVLEGKLGQKIAGENILLTEEPQLDGGLGNRSFDDEAVRCTSKTLIADGKLETYLYNRQSAKAEEKTSGGNGFKPSFSDEVETGYTNVVLHPGKNSREELLAKMGHGLLISGVSGTFAGANATSGNFSLIAKGYRVENGQLGKGVTQITVAGNFFEMLRNIEALGSELENMGSTHGYVYAPALLVKALAISGEEK